MTPVQVVGYSLTAALLTVAILAAVLPSITRSRRARNLASTFLAAAVLVGAPQAALADSKTVGGYVYQSDTMDCAWIRGTISNSARPRMDSVASADWGRSDGMGGIAPCANKSKTLLPGNIAVRQDLAYWNGSAWLWCNNGPFVYNQTTSHSSSTGFGWSSPPCGMGYYYNSPGAWTNNGGWHGGFTFTGYIWVS